MSQIGVIGLGTMGANLARNAARNGAVVAVFNRTAEKVEEFVRVHGKEGTFVPCNTLAKLTAALKTPRAILLMVKAGEAVDEVIAELSPLLSKGDILIDGGNSDERDTARREAELKKKGFRFLGMGVSGGERGALLGPSLMPGGDRSAYDELEPLLIKMAAKVGGGTRDGGQGNEQQKCVAFLGSGGVGHFVKMIHNGIEYGMMQLLAESYDLLRREGGKTNEELAEIFEQWNRDERFSSFLLEITAKILRKGDSLLSSSESRSGDSVSPRGANREAYLLDAIKDAAAQKGTGKWVTEAALRYGVSVPTITAAVDARIISSTKDFRMKKAKEEKLALEEVSTLPCSPEDIRTALELSIINTYAQGFQLLSEASREEQWNLDLSEVARIWRGGCIIRSALLSLWQRTLKGDPSDPESVRAGKAAGKELRGRFSEGAQRAWRRVVARGALRGVPLPAMSASLSYYDAYRTERLPQNLIQAQRDFFGAHTYERLDKPGTFHTAWE